MLLLYHCGDSLSGINGVIRPGIVHRIDKNTSGLLIVAKTDNAHKFLAEQIKVHSFTREYECIACGRFKETEGTVDAPIGRNPNDRKKCALLIKIPKMQSRIIRYWSSLKNMLILNVFWKQEELIR